MGKKSVDIQMAAINKLLAGGGLDPSSAKIARQWLEQQGEQAKPAKVPGAPKVKAELTDEQKAKKLDGLAADLRSAIVNRKGDDMGKIRDSIRALGYHPDKIEAHVRGVKYEPADPTKNEQRQQLNQQVEQFKAQGGKIRGAPAQATPPPPTSARPHNSTRQTVNGNPFDPVNQNNDTTGSTPAAPARPGGIVNADNIKSFAKSDADHIDAMIAKCHAIKEMLNKS
jgi:hypothetical protein